MTDLTAFEVYAILAAESVDTSRLEIREESGGVVIRGPEEDRWEATGVLFAAGLAHAPYDGRDEWQRRQDPGA